MPPVIHQNKCVGCMTCAAICPADVFGLQRKGAPFPEIRYPDECWHCNSCVLECNSKAISLRIPLTHMMVYMNDPNVKENTENK
ncbi:MAG: ferredoxin family protein [Oscillospiraceae bacterium]|nr:ferredoxin family protein [Oscillospiraceae bacterium]